jgi:hypothetical protein
MAKMILAIPLFQSFREDMLIWKDDKDKQYSVRKGYKRLMVEKWSHIGGRTT